MTDQYEIREDELNPVYPFQVVKNGRALLRQYATRDEAQAVIDQATQPFNYEIGLNEILDQHEGKPATEEPEKHETEDEIVIDSQEQVGSIIEFHGDKWLVVSSRYITEKEAAEIEETHDAYVKPGWDTVIKKVMNEGDAVVVTGSGYGILVKQDEETTRVRFLTGSEEDIDSRYVEPAAPSMAEKIKEQGRKGV